jgi:hypothetical protein
MPIKVDPFINPFRTHIKPDNSVVEVIIVNGKTYEKVVRKHGNN